MNPSSSFQDLVELVAILRRECPWDREQTHESVKGHLIEEAYEVVEAIESGDIDELRKELGDVLLHVLFHAQMESEVGSFTISDVIRSLSEKLIRRHPHVFGETAVSGTEDVKRNWEALKRDEGRASVLDGVPGSLPGLLKAQRIQEKASGVGFDWKQWQPAWEKLQEEIQEWKETLPDSPSDGPGGVAVDVMGDAHGENGGGGEAHRTGEAAGAEELLRRRREEFGDVLFSLVNVGRLLSLSAEDALQATNAKFVRRFQYIERRLAEEGTTPEKAGLERMDEIWNESKSRA